MVKKKAKLDNRTAKSKKYSKNKVISSPYPTPKRRKFSTPFKSKNRHVDTPNRNTAKSPQCALLDDCILSEAYDHAFKNYSPKYERILTRTASPSVHKLHSQSPPSVDDIFLQKDNYQNDLLASVLQKLDKVDCKKDFETFLDLVSRDKFPLENIAFLLFLDTVRFMGCKESSTMRYRSNTKSFWKAGRNLFHNKFLYFMGGPRSLGNEEGMIEEEKFPRINFAVPNETILNNFKSSSFDTCIPKRMNTGCLSHILDSVCVESNESYMLCADAKKVTSGLDKQGGDVDMFGYENGETLRSKQGRLLKNLDDVKAVKELCSDDEVIEKKVELSIKLKDVIVILCNRMRECKELGYRQEYGLQKFLSLGGTDWRNSKYVYAISGLQASLFQLKQQIKNTHREVFILCREISSIQNPLCIFHEGKVVDVDKMRNIIRLTEWTDDSDPKETRFIQQRSSLWHTLRKSACVTGSSLHNALGLRGLKEQKQHFEEYIEGKSRPISPDLEKRLTHGTENEKHAIATLIGTLLPVYFPSASFVEEGCYLVKSDIHNRTLLEVSPDGSIRDVEHCAVTGEPLSLGKCIAAIEIKCPFPNQGEARPHYFLPEYYVAQCLAEMHVLKTEHLLFISYTETSTTAFNVTFDPGLWTFFMDETRKHYDTEVLQKCRKLSENVPSLKEKISAFTKSNVQFLGEFESKTWSDGEDCCIKSTKIPFLFSSVANVCIPPSVSAIDIRNGLDRSMCLINEIYNLLRQKATEVMVWVLSNKDRNSKQETPCSIPIAFSLKDYKLTSGAMRSATEHVLRECKERKIRIDSLSADGQWIQLMNRDGKGRPSTIYQLQKDVWQRVKKIPKPELVKKLLCVNVVDSKDVYNNDEIICIEKNPATGSLFVTSQENAFATVTSTSKSRSWIGQKKPKTITNVEQESQDNETNLDPSEILVNVDWLPTEIIQEASNNQELLKAIRLVDTTRSSVREKCALNSVPENIEPLEQEENDEHFESTQTNLANERTIDFFQSDDCIKELLKRLQNASSKWLSGNMNVVREALLNLETLTHTEIDLTYEYISSIRSNNVPLRKSWNKARKISALKSILFDYPLTNKTSKRRLRSPLTLKVLCARMLRSRKVPKEVIGIAYAQYTFPHELQKWFDESCIPKEMKIEGFESKVPFWFSLPEFSTQTGSILTKGIDCSHNLTHLRVRTSTTGICGVSPDAWIKCAKLSETDLHPAIVEHLLDKQSVAFARTHFSEEVEQWMERNSYYQAAKLTNLIRKWYEASDSPSIRAHDRVKDLLAFRNHLLDGINFGEFPPIKRYFKGIPVVSFEGLLMDIDSKLQLYGICDSYNIRSVGSLASETAVGVLQTLNNTSQVSIKAVDVPRIMAKAVEVMSCRLNPNRGFFMRTSRRSGIYPVQKGALEKSNEYNTYSTEEPSSYYNPIVKLPCIIQPKDHPFDKLKRGAVRQIKFGTVSGPSYPSRGAQPVRQWHRRDETKILPMLRLGVEGMTTEQLSYPHPV